MPVAEFTYRYDKWVGEGREEDTTEEKWGGEHRFCLKVTVEGLVAHRLQNVV